MKNKKLNKALLPAVLLIWLGVLFQWERASEERAIHSSQSDVFVLVENAAEEIPKLKLVYRDPFLDRTFSPKKNTNSNRAFDQVLAYSTLQPPKISASFLYKGALETETGNVALLELNEKLLYLKQGEYTAGWKCNNINWDQVILTQETEMISLKLGRDTLLKIKPYEKTIH